MKSLLCNGTAGRPNFIIKFMYCNIVQYTVTKMNNELHKYMTKTDSILLLLIYNTTAFIHPIIPVIIMCIIIEWINFYFFIFISPNKQFNKRVHFVTTNHIDFENLSSKRIQNMWNAMIFDAHVKNQIYLYGFYNILLYYTTTTLIWRERKKTGIAYKRWFMI